jgi:oxaloacetate decarboxylase alpha subunit
MASMAYFKAAEAGVDLVDCAISSMSLGTSQPPTETLVAAMAGTPRDTGLDLAKLSAIGKHFASVRKNYDHLEMKTYGVDTNVLQFQVAGMISNLVNQLRGQGRRKLPGSEGDPSAGGPRLPALVPPARSAAPSGAQRLMGERYRWCRKR